MPTIRKWPRSQFSGKDSNLIRGYIRSEGREAQEESGRRKVYVVSGSGFLTS